MRPMHSLDACVRVWYRCDGGSSSDGSGSPSDASYYRVSELIGVACIDMSLIASDADLRATPGWPDLEARVLEERSLCPYSHRGSNPGFPSPKPTPPTAMRALPLTSPAFAPLCGQESRSDRGAARGPS